MATQGKHHMGGTRRYVKNMMNIPASRANIKEKTPVAPARPINKGPWSTIGTQPTREMLGIKTGVKSKKGVK